MANFLLAYGNQADDATLTAGSWNASYPLDNLKDYRVAKKARTADALAASTKLRFALASSAYIGAVSLIATNASTAATYQVKLFSDSGFTTTVYDSGSVTLYPAGTIPESQIPAGAPNSGTAKPTAEEIARFQRNINHILSTAMYAQYGEIAITDTTNSAGYIEAGRLFVGSVFRPAENPDHGKASIRVTPRTEIVRARDGTPYFNVQKADLCVPFALDWLTKDEAMKVLDIMVQQDLHGECLVIWDDDDDEYAFRRQVFGHLKQLDPIEHPQYSIYSTAFQVEGIVA